MARLFSRRAIARHRIGGSNMNGKNPFEDAAVIFSYTRAQAIEDGVLVDLTAWARETGFKVPVACTATVWQGYIVPPPKTEGWGQSERGRAHDLLWMVRRFTA